MDTIAIDGLDEHDFRYAIEDMLRLDHVEEAVEKLRGLLKPYAGEGGILPARFLEVTADDIEIGGWDRIADRLYNHDKPGHPVTAIGVTMADARALGGPGPLGGCMPPFIKTFYFSDEAYPFSDATRDDLLDGYSREGFEWEGDYQATDATLSIRGIDDLYGAVVGLEDRLLDSADPSEDEIRAGTIGACYLATLIHQALRRMIRQKGLPRPMCMLAACDGVYPFFEAPVAGSDECMVEKGTESVDEVFPAALQDAALADEAVEALPAPAAEASILDLVSRKGTKKPVMILDESDAREATRYAEMAAVHELGIDDEQALKGLLETIPVGEPPATIPDAAAGDDDDWGDFDVPDHHAESETPPVAAEQGLPLPEPAADQPAAGLPPFAPPPFAPPPVEPPVDEQPIAETPDEEPVRAEPAATVWPVDEQPSAEQAAIAVPDFVEFPTDAVESAELEEAPLPGGPEPTMAELQASWDAGEEMQADFASAPDLPVGATEIDKPCDSAAAEPVNEPVEAPVRHHLRARIELAQPEPEEGFWQRFVAAIAGLMRKIFRR